MARYIQFICTITESLHVSFTVAYLWLTSVHHIKFIKYSKTLIQMDRNVLQLKNINLKSRPIYLSVCLQFRDPFINTEANAQSLTGFY